MANILFWLINVAMLIALIMSALQQNWLGTIGWVAAFFWEYTALAP